MQSENDLETQPRWIYHRIGPEKETGRCSFICENLGELCGLEREDSGFGELWS